MTTTNRQKLTETISMLQQLYGPRNRMYMRGDTAILFLHQHFANLQKDVLRNGELDKKIVGGRLASLFAMTIAYADSFGDLPFVRALCMKYPQENCTYCGKKPCSCEINREKGAPRLKEVSREQMEWSISNFVENLDTLYGKNNRQRGIQIALLRLMEEIHEAEGAQLFEDMNDPNVTVDERRMRLAKEFSDVLAWIFSISAMLEIDLQQEVHDRYSGNCRRCDNAPCQCAAFKIYKTRSNPVGSGLAETVTPRQ